MFLQVLLFQYYLCSINWQYSFYFLKQYYTLFLE
uniref:Uncharacterized protein n=1 Tax=Myoviridae sp. ctjhW4 TaxID=2825162 RepID=A0A8S5PT40_9CAUD|nr:MAG TPA: hypothetical protein [Myoviridae sp. ctjhW4]